MSNCKPIDELTIEDLKQNPIWEWAIDEEENEEHDETWVKPAATTNFTEGAKRFNRTRQTILT